MQDPYKPALRADVFGYGKARGESHDGPSFGDEGSPLVCNGVQIGIFAFPVYKCNGNKCDVRSLWTRLDRYKDWMDEMFEGRTAPGRQTYTMDNAYTDKPGATTIQWQPPIIKQSSANHFIVCNFITVCIFILYINIF